MQKLKNRRSGFTIVELLIVVVVIAVLAAIVVVSYTGIQNRARTSALVADLRNVATRLSVDKVETGLYPTALSTANNGKGIKVSDDTTLKYTAVNNPSEPTFCLSAISAGIAYHVTPSAPPAEGLCSGHTMGDDAPEVSLVQQATGCCGYGTQSASFPSQPTQGNLLIAIAAHRSDANVGVIDGTGWNKVIENHYSTGNTDRRGLVVFWKIAGAGEPATVSINWSGGAVSINSVALREYSSSSEIFNLAGSTVTNSGSSFVNNISTGSTASISADNSLLLAIAMNRDPEPTASWSNGLANGVSIQNETTIHTAWATSQSAGTKQSTLTLGSSRHVTAGLLVFEL